MIPDFYSQKKVLASARVTSRKGKKDPNDFIIRNWIGLAAFFISPGLGTVSRCPV
jgi:hypothetical protein